MTTTTIQKFNSYQYRLDGLSRAQIERMIALFDRKGLKFTNIYPTRFAAECALWLAFGGFNQEVAR